MAHLGTTENLNVVAEQKNMLRIEAIRERNRIRRERILNARERTIGIDSMALARQVAERKQMRQQEKQSNLDYQSRCTEIMKILEARDTEAAISKKKTMTQMKDSWRIQIQENEIKRNTRPELDPIDFTKCGQASAQVFQGEDVIKEERVKLQKLQMKNWIKQQVAEKEKMKAAEKEDQLKYDALMKYVTEQAELKDKEERAMKKKTDALLRVNLELAAEYKAKQTELKKINDEEEAKEITNMLGDPILCEENNFISKSSGRIDKSRFRCFTKGMNQQIYADNEKLAQAARQRKLREKEEDKLWAMQQEMVKKKAEEVELQQQLYKKAIEMENYEKLRTDLEQKNMKNIKKKENGFGDIDTTKGWYAGFGQSHR